MKRKRCELLAPAGGPEQLKAAVENGADAVYLGGHMFNARINAGNFSREQLKEAVDYAHLRGAKIYVTLNTLIKDEEIGDALIYAAELYAMGTDGLIIQDLGIGRLIREYMPDLPLHLSTQGTIYNVEGVRAAKKLGFERVVPARELTLEEIKGITKEKICDIEVFVHGALCICYSGQCQLSRAIGGRSGNRGECAQPCRLAYTDDRGRKGYWLSPKDLCLLERLPELVDAGVASLKIEGRMKSPQYVATVTRIYRKYLDMCDKGEYRIDDRDRRELEQVFNRGGFTEGYINGDPGDELMSGELSKHLGTYLGTVIAPAGRELIDINPEKPLSIGDGVEIHSRVPAGNVVTYLEERKNGAVRIGDIKGDVRPGDPVYKITDAKLMKQAEMTYSGKGKRKTDVDMTFIVKEGNVPVLFVSLGGITAQEEGKAVPEAALNRALDNEAAARQLKKTGNTPFHAAGIKTVIDEGLAMPASEINRIRRRALKKLEEKMTEGRKAPEIPHISAKGEKLQITEKAPQGALHLPPVTKGNADRYIKENFDRLPKDIIVENPGWIVELAAAGRNVYAGAGLNVCNRYAKEAVESLGAVCTAPSPEAEKEPEILMITEHHIKTGKLKDRKGQMYDVREGKFGDKWLISKAKTSK